jgi:TRAP-type C4-dicarboxylate transport system permease large subunit
VGQSPSARALVDGRQIALFCVGTASAFGWLLAYYKIPEAILTGVSAWGMGFMATGFFIAFVFLVVGCFLDAIPAIIICAPILEPLARAVQMDPVHFAMIGIVSLAFGLVTPPYGLCLMISCAIGQMRLVAVMKDVMIMLMPMLGVLALIIVWPDVALWLPRQISPEFLK